MRQTYPYLPVKLEGLPYGAVLDLRERVHQVVKNLAGVELEITDDHLRQLVESCESWKIMDSLKEKFPNLAGRVRNTPLFAEKMRKDKELRESVGRIEDDWAVVNVYLGTMMHRLPLSANNVLEIWI